MIYFIRRSDGAIKIGYSSNVVSRKSSLQAQHGTLELLGVAQGSQTEELTLHKRFAQSRIGRAEWFHPSPDILSYIAEHANIAIPKTKWTTLAVSKKLAFSAQTLAGATGLALEEVLWKALKQEYPDKMLLIDQLMPTVENHRHTND